MRHLLVCPEFPPCAAGGIGTYAEHLSRLLAERGEAVHVVAPLWKGAPSGREVREDGRLVVHRLPYLSWRSPFPRRPHRSLDSEEARRLFATGYPPQAFSWQAGLLVERLVEEESIDVIEAQEYEAPLYYFLLRRALGLGPQKRRPPVLVHLHSPTELILRYDDWATGHPYLLTAPRLETYSMRAADALLSPSRYLAAAVEKRLGLGEGAIDVIPYPIGEADRLERSAETWRAGSICYVGRLEGRKGVLEWIDAAVAAARRDPGIRFEFVGENVLGDGTLPGDEIVERRIPSEVRGQFRFHGRRPRRELGRFLARARLGVVPSRWDNFPNTCVEAMASGLPVLATRCGGMAEMIEDGASGWLAEAAEAGSLLEALSRALETPPDRLAEMGREAAARIRRVCDDDRICDLQMELRRRLVRRGAERSLSVPVLSPLDGERSPGADPPGSSGIAVVVSSRSPGRTSHRCLDSLERQTRPPCAVVLADEELASAAASPLPGTRVLHVPAGGTVAATGARGLAAIREASVRPLGVVFADVDDRLAPRLVERYEAVLGRCPEIGLVSCWTEQRGAAERYRMRPCPSLPHQWLRNDAAPISAYRTAALEDAGGLRPPLEDVFATWDLSIGVLGAGWAAVTLPELLGDHLCPEETSQPRTASMRMRERLLGRSPRVLAGTARDLVLLARLDPRVQLAEGSISHRERLDLLLSLLRRSGSTLRWLARVALSKLRRR